MNPAKELKKLAEDLEEETEEAVDTSNLPSVKGVKPDEIYEAILESGEWFTRPGDESWISIHVAKLEPRGINATEGYGAYQAEVNLSTFDEELKGVGEGQGLKEPILKAIADALDQATENQWITL